MCHICRTAHGLLRASDTGYRHRCLWGDSSDLAVVILVKHYVSHNKNPAAFRLVLYEIKKSVIGFIGKSQTFVF